MSSSNLKKLLDNSLPFFKRYKFLMKYMDGFKGEENEVEDQEKQFYEKHHQDIFRIFEESLRHFDNTVKSRKGNRTIDIKETLSLLRLLNGFPKYCAPQLIEGWKRAAFDQLIEVFLDTKNLFSIRIRTFEFLCRTVDVLTVKTDDKLLNILNSTLNFKVFPGGNKVVLPFYDVKKSQDVFRLARTNQAEKAEEAIKYFEVLFDVVKDSNCFDWWWAFLKEHFLRIVFPKDTMSILKLEDGQGNIGFINSKCPVPIYLVFVNMIFHIFEAKSKRDTIYQTHEDVQLVLMTFEKSFEVLTAENIEVFEEIMSAYCGWIIGNEGNFAWEGMFEKERELYFRLILTAACNLIEKFSGNEEVVERHISMSYQLLDILRTFSTKGYLSHSFKSYIMKKILNLYDILMRKQRDGKYAKDFCKKMEKNYIREIFVYFISIHPDLYEYREEWTNFQNIVQKYFEQESVFDFWAKTMMNLTYSIRHSLLKLPQKFFKEGYEKYESYVSKFSSFEHKKKREMKEEIVNDEWEVPKPLFEDPEHLDTILQMFHIFLSFYGVENKKYSISIHSKKVKTLFDVVDLFLNIFDCEITVKAGQCVPHVPEGNRLLELMIGPLLEACYRDDESFVYGRLDAFVTLCKIFCFGRYYVRKFETESLARFYRAIYKGLNEKSNMIVDEIIKHSWNIFTFDFPASHLLIPHYMRACIDVIQRSEDNKILNLCARRCLNALIPVLYFYGDMNIPSLDEKSKEKNFSFQILREKLFKFYETQSKAKHEFPAVETYILWGLYFFVTYEIDRSSDVRHIIQLIMNSLLSSSNEVWITSHDIISSIAQMKLIRRMDAETIMRLVQEICFKILHLRITGFQNPKAIVSLMYTLLEVIVEIPFPLFVADKTFPTLIFKMIAFARESKNDEIRTAADVLLTFTLNFLNRFPLPIGSDVISSDVTEFDFMEKTEKGSFQPSENIHHFTFNSTHLYTIIDLPDEDQTVIVIIRDCTGRYAWKCKFLYEEKDTLYEIKSPSVGRSMKVAEPVKEEGGKGGEEKKNPIVLEGPPEHDEKINTDKTDMLKLYQMYINSEFPECDGYMLNVLIPVEDQDVIKEELIVEIGKQVESEKTFLETTTIEKFEKVEQPKRQRGDNPFAFGRVLLNHLGLFSPEFKPSFCRMNSTHHFYRKLKYLDDKLMERETIKVGLIYVKNGQENESDILRNERGSNLFKEFLQSLAWEIDLATHKGFLGGLQKNGTTGLTTHYFSNATTELIFHISTYMPTKENDLVQVKKKRHIGNDWIHIVWSEHDRDYRRWTIGSQFNYGHIIIYPLGDPFFRIEVCKKEGVPIIGPLQENMIIDKKHLAPLVRQTAINANKVVRYTQPGYKKNYLTRKDNIDEIIEQYCHEEDSWEGMFSYVMMKDFPENLKFIKKKNKKTSSVDSSPLISATPSSSSSTSASSPQRANSPSMGSSNQTTSQTVTPTPRPLSEIKKSESEQEKKEKKKSKIFRFGKKGKKKN